MVHAADDLSAAGHWTDVKVKERNLPSLFRTLGLPLNRAGGRARVEIRPALSGHRFLPLAIPDNELTRVQVRYYNECTNTLIPNSTYDLTLLPDDYQKVWRSTGGGGLWGLEGTNHPWHRRSQPARSHSRCRATRRAAPRRAASTRPSASRCGLASQPGSRTST